MIKELFGNSICLANKLLWSALHPRLPSVQHKNENMHKRTELLFPRHSSTTLHRLSCKTIFLHKNAAAFLLTLFILLPLFDSLVVLEEISLCCI